MTLEDDNDAMATADDLNTTVPNIKPGEWKMPEPVFRKTSGRLRESFARKFEPASAPKTSSDLETPASQVEPGPESPVLKIVIVALALAAMVAFIAAFLTAIYFFFLRSE